MHYIKKDIKKLLFECKLLNNHAKYRSNPLHSLVKAKDHKFTTNHVKVFPQFRSSFHLTSTSNHLLNLRFSSTAAGGAAENGGGDSSSSKSSSWENLGLFGLFIKGWKSRVSTDPQFPFKVLMEELVGVTSCVIGDMASRPNFGLNELDFVFSTLIVVSILNFVLMYLLAPTSETVSPLKHLNFTRPQGHMFEPGPYTIIARFRTFAYKGILFAVVGFSGGLIGTAISNGLIRMRKKVDPGFETRNRAPPILLNAITWGFHMGLSSNIRYQVLNGVENVLEKMVKKVAFKSSVVVLRCLNNVVGGASFVVVARLIGSQRGGEEEVVKRLISGGSEVVEKVVD